MPDETFATPMTSAEKRRWFRWMAAAVMLVGALLGLLLLWRYSPEWKTWLFDLGIAGVFAGIAQLLGRRLIAAEVGHRRRIAAAIILGVVSTSAGLGVFAITLHGPPEGPERLPGLVVIQMLGGFGGAGLGFLTSLASAVVVRGAGKLFDCSTPTLDGAVIGALSGTVGGVLFLGFPHLGWWFVLASAGLCSLSGMRAGANFAATCSERPGTS